jgi:hypothetical protein
MTVGSNENGLQMSGLGSELEDLCRRIYGEFLNRHDITLWPVRITITKFPEGSLLGVAASDPQYPGIRSSEDDVPYYIVKVRFGEEPEAQHCRRSRDHIADLRFFFENNLNEWLEDNYKSPTVVGFSRAD